LVDNFNENRINETFGCFYFGNNILLLKEGVGVIAYTKDFIFLGGTFTFSTEKAKPQFIGT
jgi:hypothetical protein